MNRQNHWEGKLALVTGASSGIGAAIARRLARGGLRVALTARRAERLEALAAEIIQAGGQAAVFPADLSSPAQREALWEQVNARWGAPDVLVNDAGLGWYCWFTHMPAETARELLAVNVEAAVDLTRRALPDMLARHSGAVINISSVAGSLPMQGIALYGASKAFLDSYSTSLHRELRGSGVQVSVLRPGPVRSEFYPQAAQRSGGSPVPAERFAVSCEQVAESLWRLLRRPRRVVYVPALLRAAPWLEISFGWLIDRLGPLLLRRTAQPSPRISPHAH